MPTDLEAAIEKAKEELTEKIDKSATPPKAEPAPKSEEAEPEVELEAETEDEPESGDEPELSDAEVDEARRLYQALRNPETAGPIVAALAQQFKVNLTAESTKSEVKEAKATIKDKVKSALGKQYEFLADQIGDAIEGALEIEREAQNSRLAEIQQAQIERDVVTAYEKLARETKGESKKLEARMATLSEEIPIGKMTVDTYIKRLYTVAASESQRSSSKQVAERIRRNASDAPSRLRGSAAGTEPKIPDKKMSLKESVNFALSELTKGK